MLLHICLAALRGIRSLFMTRLAKIWHKDEELVVSLHGTTVRCGTLVQKP